MKKLECSQIEVVEIPHHVPHSAVLGLERGYVATDNILHNGVNEGRFLGPIFVVFSLHLERTSSVVDILKIASLCYNVK